jgi:hypothetical protein
VGGDLEDKLLLLLRLALKLFQVGLGDVFGVEDVTESRDQLLQQRDCYDGTDVYCYVPCKLIFPASGDCSMDLLVDFDSFIEETSYHEDSNSSEQIEQL